MLIIHRAGSELTICSEFFFSFFSAFCIHFFFFCKQRPDFFSGNRLSLVVCGLLEYSVMGCTADAHGALFRLPFWAGSLPGAVKVGC